MSQFSYWPEENICMLEFGTQSVHYDSIILSQPSQLSTRPSTINCSKYFLQQLLLLLKVSIFPLSWIILIRIQYLKNISYYENKYCSFSFFATSPFVFFPPSTFLFPLKAILSVCSFFPPVLLADTAISWICFPLHWNHRQGHQWPSCG